MPLTSPFPDSIAFAEREQSPDGVPALTQEEERTLGPAISTRRRTQFAQGRACAREALHTLGVAEPFTIGRGEGRQPLWPPGCVGSITHSHDRAAAAAAHANQYLGIGIDLERVRMPSEGLLNRVCRPTERERLGTSGEDHLQLGFTALFAAKECVYKAVNPLTGIYLGFQDAEIEFTPARDWVAGGGEIIWRLIKDSGPKFPPGTQGSGAWRRHGEWVIAGVWIAAL